MVSLWDFLRSRRKEVRTGEKEMGIPSHTEHACKIQKGSIILWDFIRHPRAQWLRQTINIEWNHPWYWSGELEHRGTNTFFSPPGPVLLPILCSFLFRANICRLSFSPNISSFAEFSILPLSRRHRKPRSLTSSNLKITFASLSFSECIFCLDM